VYRRLAEIGWHVTIISYGGASEASFADRLPGIRILSNSLGMPVRQYEGAAAWLHADTLRRSDVIKSYQVDGAETAHHAARLWAKPFVARCGYLISDFAQRSHAGEFKLGRARRIEATIFQGADRAVVTTPWMQDYIASRYQVAVEKIRVVPNYVRTDRFYPDAASAVPGRLVFVGRLETQKNPLALVDACAGLDVELAMVGMGSLAPAIATRAKQVGVNVHLLGVRSHDELPDLLRQGSLFVLPSSYEGHPKAVIEAMACGLPVLVGNVTGNSDLIEHGKTGWLCDTNADAIRAAMALLLGNPTLRAELGRNARRLVLEKYSFEQVVNLERTMLEELVR
jgi:glycosyltransferase involved in cell wall biosynthesis